MPARHSWCFLIGVLGILPAITRGSEEENWERLRALPRERRVALSERIDRFDALPRSERDAIRSLDERIAALPAADQSRYRAVLRRYHVWVQSLSEEQRLQLQNAPASQRMALVAKLMRAERSSETGGRGTPYYLRMLEFASASPQQMARQVKVWQTLTPAEKTEFAKLEAGAPRLTRLRELALRHNIKLATPRAWSAAAEDDLIRELEKEARSNGVVLPALKNLEQERARKDGEGAEGKGDPEKIAKQKHHLAESFYYAKHPPEKVRADNLMRFAEDLPPWVRPAYDPLPSDEARRRLTILYRLVYPAPDEMPAHKPAAAPPRAKSVPPAAAKSRAPSPAKTAAPPPSRKKAAQPNAQPAPF